MSDLTTDMGSDVLRASMLRNVKKNAERLGVAVEYSTPGDAFSSLLEKTAGMHGSQVALLIDEYDSPILQNIYDRSKIDEIREILKNFYVRIKTADEHLRFVFLTGISKYSKMGVISALNSLIDISDKDEYATMLGYTEDEMLSNFGAYIDKTADKRKESKEEVILKIRDYYDGFSFDGERRLYNPFSTLNFFNDATFKNYWFESATPSSLVDYIKRHDLEAEAFRGCVVSKDFTALTEIESATPESFLFQSGYLTVRARDGDNLILDYPNREVLSSVARLFMYGKLDVRGFSVDANDLEKALSEGNAGELVRMYDRLLTTIPYDIYEREEKKYAWTGTDKNRGSYPLAESFYHSLLFSMLWASCTHTTAENHSYKGRSDIEAAKNGHHYVIELKIAYGTSASEKAAETAIRQIHEKGYADKYAGKDVTVIGIAVDKEARRIGAFKIEKL
jgi:hypothetical protein